MSKIRSRTFLLILAILISTLYFVGCSQKPKLSSKQSSKYITVCAAASLKPVLDALQPKFEHLKDCLNQFINNNCFLYATA